jgi:hypothetical protein
MAEYLQDTAIVVRWRRHRSARSLFTGTRVASSTWMAHVFNWTNEEMSLLPRRFVAAGMQVKYEKFERFLPTSP